MLRLPIAFPAKVRNSPHGNPSERTKHGSPPLFVHRAEGIQGESLTLQEFRPRPEYEPHEQTGRHQATVGGSGSHIRDNDGMRSHTCDNRPLPRGNRPRRRHAIGPGHRLPLSDRSRRLYRRSRGSHFERHPPGRNDCPLLGQRGAHLPSDGRLRHDRLRHLLSRRVGQRYAGSATVDTRQHADDSRLQTLLSVRACLQIGLLHRPAPDALRTGTPPCSHRSSDTRPLPTHAARGGRRSGRPAPPPSSYVP